MNGPTTATNMLQYYLKIGIVLGLLLFFLLDRSKLELDTKVFDSIEMYLSYDITTMLMLILFIPS